MFERAKELLSRLTGNDTERRKAHELYVQIAESARREGFYSVLKVPDTVEGRYDLLSLHVILVLRRLKADRERTAGFAQLLFDVMFRDVDDTLREMGVGDLRVGKKVREYAEAFFGRAKAYEEAFDDKGNLQDAIARNVYGTDEDAVAEGLAAYMQDADGLLAEQSIDDLLAGVVQFPPPIAEGEESAA